MQRVTGGLLVVALALAALVTVQWTAPAAPTFDRDKVFQAWSESLNRRAQYERAQYEADRARAERMNAAWSERLSGIAQSQQAREGMSERAKQAWTERLTGLARHLGAGRPGEPLNECIDLARTGFTRDLTYSESRQ
jgi:hypothetical protein